MSLRLAVLSVIFTGVAAITPTFAAESTERPNVVLVIVDDLRPELGCYGCDHIHSPNIDRLAERGMRFDRAYVQMTFCNPSRTSFLTGMRPNRTRVYSNNVYYRQMLPEIETLPQLFRRAGYFTAGCGKIFHGHDPDDDAATWDLTAGLKTTPEGRCKIKRNLTDGRVRWCWWGMAEGDDEDQPDGQIARFGTEFLANRPKDKPFFLALGFHKPHDPFVAPKKYFDLYPPESIRIHRDPDDMSPTLDAALGGWKREFAKFTDREKREFLRAYYACTSFTDAQWGKVAAELDRQDLWNDTIVVFIADHGYHLGERGWWNKNTLFEYSARTPLLVWKPGMKAAGKPCASIVEFVDIFPTLQELCGLPETDHRLDGKSFAALLDDPTLPGKEAAFSQNPYPGYSVRTDRWRLVLWNDGAAGVELYDHRQDPGEWHNLADDPQYRSLIDTLAAPLHRMYGEGPQRPIPPKAEQQAK
ncbi:sulfatase [Thermostilla marina]